MMKISKKIINKVLLVILFIFSESFTGLIYAQVPPPPPPPPTPPVGLIPWGNPLIYFVIVFGYSLYRMRRMNTDK